MKRFDQINMIPFIDIMLVLLAIVLTTASFVSQGLIDVKLPKAEQVKAIGDIVPLEISIDASNQLYVGDSTTNLDQLNSALDNTPKDTLILLRIDKTAQFEYFISLIDKLKVLGFNNVSVHAESLQ